MTYRWTAAVAAIALAMVTHTELAAQQPQASNARPAPAVGDMAPDFEIRGSTRYGLLRDGAKLSDFRGQTVVLAFFARSRTRG